MEIGKAIKLIREQQGLSMTALAKKAGIGQSTISHIENDNTQPTFDVLERIITALGYTLSDFFAGDKPELEPDLRRLLDAAKRLTPEEREKLTDLLNTMKG
ncbi:MAG: helix-turn-helix domain-containing protein [Negativicutes bacterium]|nr:helix-turn-helix domain-containing protein [Negativicutes bacterium]